LRNTLSPSNSQDHQCCYLHVRLQGSQGIQEEARLASKAAGPDHVGDHSFVMNPKEHTIMIVDDDPTNVHVLETLLAQDGFQTVSAATGFQALECFAQSTPKPSCVLLDIGLPDISGAIDPFKGAPGFGV
jgi:PleD family two-component response regulator